LLKRKIFALDKRVIAGGHDNALLSILRPASVIRTRATSIILLPATKRSVVAVARPPLD
jgi:hypothetical protein